MHFRNVCWQLLLIVFFTMGCSKVNEPVLIQKEIETMQRGSYDKNPIEEETIATSQEEESTLVQSPINVSIEYVSNPQRWFAKLYAYDEMIAFYQLPYDDNVLAFRFNQPMERLSVERAIEQSLENHLSYQFDWEDDYTVYLQFSGVPSDQVYVIRFNGITSQTGEEMRESVIFSFKLIEPKSFYSYSLEEGTEKLIYSPKMAIDDATLLSDAIHVLITDQAGDFFGPYYDVYLLNLSDGTLIHQREDKYYEKLAEMEFYEDHTVYIIYDVDIGTIQEALQEEGYSVTYQGSIFSPDRRKVAVLTIEDSYYTLQPEQIYPIHLTVLDRETQQIVHEYKNLFTDIFEYDGTDAIPPERYLHYKPKNARWMQEDQIIIEYLNEDETEMIIGRLNLATGEFHTLARGVIDPVFSSTMPYFIARIWNEPIAHLYNVNGEVVHTFPVSKIQPPIWSKGGDRFVYIDPEGKVFVYDVRDRSSTYVGENLNISGWLDEEHLLIYK